MMLSRMLRLLLVIAIPTLALGAGLGAKRHKYQVRATLEDGQVLYGDVRTSRLSLSGPLGDLKIPLEDIGEVVPVEGGQVGDSQGHVRVWLRDGSELTGQWMDPEVAMGIRVGKEDVRVDLPPEKLNRLQTQGGEVWPGGTVYRVRTVHGDDFLVDARTSRFTLINDLGSFSPALSDCISVRPVDDPEEDWRVELGTGTVLIGRMQGNQLTLAMPLGPDEVTVPLASFQSMEQQTWSAMTASRRDVSTVQTVSVSRGGPGRKKAAQAPYSDWEAVEAAPAPPAAAITYEEADDGRAGGWFQRHSLEAAKQAAQ
jgi:hypothetical protein